MPGAGIEPARLAAGDFESPASTNFTTRARGRDKYYDIELSCGLGCVSGGFELALAIEMGFRLVLIWCFAFHDTELYKSKS